LRGLKRKENSASGSRKENTIGLYNAREVFGDFLGGKKVQGPVDWSGNKYFNRGGHPRKGKNQVGGILRESGGGLSYGTGNPRVTPSND